MSEFRVPHCDCGHAVGDHKSSDARGLTVAYGICLASGCACTEFVERVETCDACAGTKTCTECDGDGVCPECQDEEIDGERAECETCGGNGDCVACDGTGACAECDAHLD